MSNPTKVLAGNVVRVTFTLPPLTPPLTVLPTVKTCITTAAGVTTTLTPLSSTIVAGSLVVVVEAALADTVANTNCTITVDTSGSMVAAAEAAFYVTARREPAVP